MHIDKNSVAVYGGAASGLTGVGLLETADTVHLDCAPFLGTIGEALIIISIIAIVVVIHRLHRELRALKADELRWERQMRDQAIIDKLADRADRADRPKVAVWIRAQSPAPWAHLLDDVRTVEPTA